MSTSPAHPPAGAARAATLWFRTNEKGEWMMNHLEDGHCAGELPTPKLPSQKSVWGRGTWSKEHVWLSGELPPKVLHDPENRLARKRVTGEAT